MHVPFLDLNAVYDELKPEMDAAYQRVMETSWFIMGKELDSFEHEFAAYCGVKHCIGVGNGLDALHLILKAYEIGAGDEVIVPANTFIATWLAVSYTGAVPVPVEPDIKTYNIDPRKIEKAITPKTRAIMPVHLYGQPADMDPILEVAKKHHLIVIEDAAQAHGARYKHLTCGNLAEVAGFSFYPGKNLGALGDAGAIVSSDDALVQKIQSLRNYGSSKKYHHDAIGYNSRLDELQAAFLRAKMSTLDEWNERRKKIAAYYLENLTGISGLTLPFVPDWAEPVWHIFAVRTKQRNELQQFLKEQGVDTIIHYPIPPHLSEAYADLGYHKGSFPISEEIALTELSLPMGPHLTMDQAEYVVQMIKRYLEG